MGEHVHTGLLALSLGLSAFVLFGFLVAAVLTVAAAGALTWALYR